MSSAAIKHNEKIRKQSSLKSMYFNRYLMIRYMLALFFFSNLYWLITMMFSNSVLVLMPLLLIVIIIGAVYEQTKMYSKHQNLAKFTKLCLNSIVVNNILLIILLLIFDMDSIFPFIQNTFENKLVMIGIISAGIIISLIGLRRLSLIQNDQDKHYKRIKQYEKLLK